MAGSGNHTGHNNKQISQNRDCQAVISPVNSNQETSVMWKLFIQLYLVTWPSVSRLTLKITSNKLKQEFWAHKIHISFWVWYRRLRRYYSGSCGGLTYEFWTSIPLQLVVLDLWDFLEGNVWRIFLRIYAKITVNQSSHQGDSSFVKRFQSCCWISSSIVEFIHSNQTANTLIGLICTVSINLSVIAQ